MIATNDILKMFRVAVCIPQVKPGDLTGNRENILSMTVEAMKKGSRFVLFPELSITGYTCGDLFHDDLLLSKTLDSLDIIAAESAKLSTAIIVGAPLKVPGKLLNCAVVIANGKIWGAVPKLYLPNYNEFYENRWFASGKDIDFTFRTSRFSFPINPKLIFDIDGNKVGIEICEDLWIPEPPSGSLSKAGAEVICNLSASDELIGKHNYLLSLIANQSARCRCAYLYSSAGFGESSTDMAFSGNAIIAEDGTIINESKRFFIEPQIEIADLDIYRIRHDRIHTNTFAGLEPILPYYTTVRIELPEPIHNDYPAYREINPHPFVPANEDQLQKRCEEISSIQAWGLATRLKAIGCNHAIIGISGGLDSTLALLVTVKAFDMLHLDRKGIIGVTMPGFGTTARTKGNADKLMDVLGITHLEISIRDAVELHFRDIDHDPTVTDLTYENSQARERTQILMDMANKYNGIVIGTGDLSELALGWCTYNGDQMSMYGVNTSIPKTLVKYLVRGYALQSSNEELKKTLFDIIDTPISPELLPTDEKGNIKQKTEDTVGPYRLHDFFLYHTLRYGSDPLRTLLLAKKAFEGVYDEETILKWLKVFYTRFFSQQFKRSCMPDGVKVGSICLSPRGDWRMPSDASSRLWLERLDEYTQK